MTENGVRLHTEQSAEDIEAQARAYAPWFYRFAFSNGVVTEGVDPYVDEIHANRAATIFPHLDRLFSGRWAQVQCLDIAAHEGWFSFQLAERGVESVLGVDNRPLRVEKANWLARVGGIANARFEVGDLYELDPAHLGTFDIVLFVGIFYHLENPMGALRIARRLTKHVCVLEGQIAQGSELKADWSGDGTARYGPGCVVLPGETEHADEPTGVVVIPTLAALQMMLFRAGFRDVHLVLSPPTFNEQYRSQNRVMLFAYV